MITSSSFGMHHIFIPSDKPDAPTLLLLHGTGGDEYDLVHIGQSLLPGAAILSARGNVQQQGMNRYFLRKPDGSFDTDDLLFRTGELNGFILLATEHYNIDRSTLIAVGYSNGATIAASILLVHPKTLHLAVLLHPALPFMPEQKPHITAHVFMTAGRNDEMIPFERTKALATLLSSCGAEVAFHAEEGGHRITESELEAAREWING
ncbi:MAG: phospholipase/Carboxylesterase [Candidatus Peribacteria bacterium]|nr:phospholipase/Carboxylesterase [Candidatus Peribacteria bacterium]